MIFDNMNDYYGSETIWFVGTVRDIYPDYVKVRCFGIHGLEDNVKISDGDLPPAVLLYPITGGQVSNGYGGHNLQIGSWVVGIFADGKHCQQPIIIGVLGDGLNSTSTVTDGPRTSNDFASDNVGGDLGVDSAATINIPGGSNIEKSYNYVYDKIKNMSSDPHMHTSAVIGVLMLETSGINPKVVGGYQGRAWGICQWLGTRRDQLFAKYGKTKDLAQQLDFMWWELNNTETKAKKRWLSASNLPDAVDGFCGFERAEEWLKSGRANRNHGNFKKRLKYAYQIYNSMKPSQQNWGKPNRRDE